MWKQVLVAVLAVGVLIAMLPAHEASSQPFASPAFEQVWLQQQNGLLDLWGQTPLAWRIEPYADAPNGRRLVQYFDRGRMELNATASSTGLLVTQGRLAWELTTGQVALGSDLVARRPPPAIPIDGGPPDPRVPTYAALSSLTASRADDRSDFPQLVTDWISADGSLRTASPPASVRLGRYVSVTGHNLPDVTVALFDRWPRGSASWIELFGYPISEPVWSYYRRGTTAYPSLIQVFERRILVYTPALPAEQRFTLVNTGRHYYRWRYGTDPSQPWPAPLPGAPLSLPLPPAFQAGSYVENLRDPVSLALSPGGDLLVLTRSGTLLLVAAEDSEGRASRLTTLASGFADPRGVATAGPWVYVTDERGLTRLRDDDGDGVADRRQLLPTPLVPLPGPAGAPVVDELGRLYLVATTPEAPQTALLYTVQGDRVFPLAPAPPALVRLLAWGELVFALVQSSDEPARLVRLQPPTSPGSGEFLTLPPGFQASGGLVYTLQLWTDPIPGTLFFWGLQDGSGVLLRAVPRPDGRGAEVSAFATGFRHPVAATVGLDGTLYIADAEAARIVKILPAGRSASNARWRLERPLGGP